MNNNKKNALIIAYNDLNNSGVPNLIYQIVNALSDYYNFDIVSFGDNDFYYSKLKNDGVENVNLLTFDRKPKENKLSRICWELFFKHHYFFKKTKKILKNKHYEIVHSFKETDSWSFLKASAKMGVRKRIVHSTVVLTNTFKGILAKLKDRAHFLTNKYATDFIGVSDHCCKIAFPGKSYTVLYNGYDENAFNFNCKNELKNDELVISQLATYNSNKNQIFSLEVLYELKQLYKNCTLKLIGKETEKGYLRKINDYVKMHNLEDNVQIIDGTYGVGRHFCTTTFTILPSIKEGAGITAIESQACGIKVFASSNVTPEMNAGGTIYIDLEQGAKYWAEKIYEEFKNNGNQRTQFDLDKFSKDTFRVNIKKIYGII